MNITQERYSLIKLWLESFKVVNRCAGKLLIVAIALGLLMWLAQTLLLSNMSTMLQSPNPALSLKSSAGYPLFSLFANICTLLFVTVSWRIVAAYIHGNPQPLSQAFFESLVPTLFLIVAGLLVGIAWGVVLLLFLIIAALLHSPVVYVFAILGGLLIGIRFFYAFIAIAVADKGPIEGLVHSWKMTKNNYLDTLGMCMLSIATMILLALIFGAVAYGLYIVIPLHFPTGFNLGNLSLSWRIVGFVIGIFATFGYLIVLTFPLLVFLNRNAVLFDARNMREKDTTFVPLPALELPDIHPNPNPEHMQQAESTMRTPVLTDADLHPMQEEVPPTAPVAAPAQKPAPIEKPQPQAMPSLDGVEVSKSSINTSEEDTNKLSEHLDQVYKPKPEDVVQYVDEDRMPTILFDDDMAKQLQANQAQYAPKPKAEDSDKKDNGPDAIKMSKF